MGFKKYYKPNSNKKYQSTPQYIKRTEQQMSFSVS